VYESDLKEYENEVAKLTQRKESENEKLTSSQKVKRQNALSVEAL